MGKLVGGAIWIEKPEGCIPQTTPGCIKMGIDLDLEVNKGPVTSNAFDSFHFTRAWKGNRLVLVAYTTDKTSELTADSSFLQELGFRPLPVGVRHPRLWIQRERHGFR